VTIRAARPAVHANGDVLGVCDRDGERDRRTSGKVLQVVLPRLYQDGSLMEGANARGTPSFAHSMATLASISRATALASR
jgi:hypothetical protein